MFTFSITYSGLELNEFGFCGADRSAGHADNHHRDKSGCGSSPTRRQFRSHRGIRLGLPSRLHIPDTPSVPMGQPEIFLEPLSGLGYQAQEVSARPVDRLPDSSAARVCLFILWLF